MQNIREESKTPFWDPLAAILDFAGGAALQVQSKGHFSRFSLLFTDFLPPKTSRNVSTLMIIICCLLYPKTGRPSFMYLSLGIYCLQVKVNIL